MSTTSKTLVTLLIGAGLGFAQSVYTYNNQSTSNGILYLTGVMQAGSWNYPGAQHTYTQTLSIRSPSGRSNSCGFNATVPAIQYYDNTCTAQLSIYDNFGNADEGTYSISGSQTADCNEVGQFAYVPISLQAGAQRIKAYYYNANSASKNPNGTYSVLYARCHPIGSTCDYASVIYGGPPYPQYGLFDGLEIHLLGFNYCQEQSVVPVNDCSLPDPVPGVGGGIWAKDTATKLAHVRVKGHACKNTDLSGNIDSSR